MRIQMIYASGVICFGFWFAGGCSDSNYAARKQADETTPMLYRNVPEGDTPSRNPAMNNSGTGGQDREGERTGLLNFDKGRSDVGTVGKPGEAPPNPPVVPPAAPKP